MPVPSSEPMNEGLDQHLDTQPPTAPEAAGLSGRVKCSRTYSCAERAPTVLVGDGIVVDESGSYWYSYR